MTKVYRFHFFDYRSSLNEQTCQQEQSFRASAAPLPLLAVLCPFFYREAFF